MELELELELVINGVPTDRIVPVQVRGERYFVTVRDLRSVSLSVPGEDSELLALDMLPGVTATYETQTLRLRIDVPADWLPHHSIGRTHLSERMPARVDTGILFNYEVYASGLAGNNLSSSAWSETRMFGPSGIFSNTLLAKIGPGQDTIRRLDTSWQYSDEHRMLTFEAGDLVTRSVLWGSTVRLGGFQISRDFSVRPDVITYPLPQFFGEAALPSSVDLFINGYRSYGADVDPGPFTLSSVPFINGAGQAEVVVTDTLGRAVSTSVPFYVSSDLLRPGLFDFAASVGAMRRGYGQDSFSYGAVAATGSLRYGVSSSLTLEASGETGTDFINAGAGAVLRIGAVGVISGALSGSRYEGLSGSQWNLAYHYNSGSFGIAARHERRSAHFANLAVYEAASYRLPRESTMVTGTLAVPGIGTLGGGYFDSTAYDGQRLRLANLALSAPVAKHTTLYVSGNHEIAGHGWNASVQLLVTLGGRGGSISAGLEGQRDRGPSWRMDYNRSAPSEGGLGWNVGYTDSRDGRPYVRAGLGWRTPHIELRGGVYGPTDRVAAWGSASGSLVLMGGSTFVSNRINDAFAVVRTGREAGVPVRYENQLVGRTDRNGRVLVPWASSYYQARYSIDPLELPENARVSLVEQKVAVRRGSGAIVDFPISRVTAAEISLRDQRGAAIPPGSLVELGKRTTYVGLDGFTYLEGVEENNSIVVQRPDGSRCRAKFAYGQSSSATAQIKPVVCVDVQP